MGVNGEGGVCSECCYFGKRLSLSYSYQPNIRLNFKFCTKTQLVTGVTVVLFRATCAVIGMAIVQTLCMNCGFKVSSLPGRK